MPPNNLNSNDTEFQLNDLENVERNSPSPSSDSRTESDESLPLLSLSSSKSDDQSISTDSGVAVKHTNSILTDAMIFQQFLTEKGKTEDLNAVTEIDLHDNINAFIGLQQLGHFLPNLALINISGYVTKSLREMGTEFENLKILIINGCQLSSLDGILCLPNLEELYAASNNIEDIAPCAFLSMIKIIDMKRNQISDVQSIGFLSLCLELREISLDECPVSSMPDYRRIIKYILPQLISLDNQPFNSGGSCSVPLKNSEASTSTSLSGGKEKSSILCYSSTSHKTNSSTSVQLTYESRSFAQESVCDIKLTPKKLQPENLTRNVVKLPPLKNNRIIPTPFDRRPATTNCATTEYMTSKKEDNIKPRPSTSRLFKKQDYIADLETIKEELKKLPTICNPFFDEMFDPDNCDKAFQDFENEIADKEVQSAETLLASSKQWRARSELYRAKNGG